MGSSAHCLQVYEFSLWFQKKKNLFVCFFYKLEIKGHLLCCYVSSGLDLFKNLVFFFFFSEVLRGNQV